MRYALLVLNKDVYTFDAEGEQVVQVRKLVHEAFKRSKPVEFDEVIAAIHKHNMFYPNDCRVKDEAQLLAFYAKKGQSKSTVVEDVIDTLKKI